MLLPKSLRPIDIHIAAWMEKYSITFVHVALGILFFWFGVLKFFPRTFACRAAWVRTIEHITLYMVPSSIALPILAAWECQIGIGLFTGVALRATLLLLFAQMLGTLLPLALVPLETFIIFPVAPTLECRCIIKNVVLISAAIGTVQRCVADGLW